MLALGDSARQNEADAMTFVGCDLHTRKQRVNVPDPRTEEVRAHQRVHDGMTVKEFYAALPRSVTVGIESTGNAVCVHTLNSASGTRCSFDGAGQIRAMART
jgi:hypothetical protein